MSILNRPYAGTWAANKRPTTQWTPDFLVYVNGDTSLPGCPTCHHNIDLNEFINSISVDFGVEPGASNCSIGMSIPRHYGDSMFRDGNTILRTALEVHVYFRGYFPMKGLTTPNSRPVAGINLGDIPQYPYYPVFHGVVTSVTHNYSGGFYTANMTCNGMLHFWEHMKLSGAGGGSFFGARPANSGIQTTLTGHPMTGMTPYAIIYKLYRDTAGVADGVGFALSSRTNLAAVNSTTRDPLYALSLRYWEQRFRGKIYGLRMHGASGQMFTSSQQAYLSLYRHQNGTFAGSRATGNVSPSTGHPSDDIFAQDPSILLGLRARTASGRISRQADTVLLAAQNEGRNSLGMDVSQLQAFPTDIGSYGQVNLWESTYESKMDIATAVTNVCGYEFYQDADGDLVFKPPLYNLDTSSSRVYRIEPEDIVSIDFSESEPACTYVLIKGGAFQNMRGLVDESEWGCRSQYVDYRLVAQYGWIESSVESTYYTNARSAFYFAINHMDRTNAGMNAATVTIPLRPEIRPGYPVYIPDIDCFYYVTQVAHAFNLGAECTTTLTLTARRRKFLPPGNTANVTPALDQNLTAIDLSQTNAPVRALQAIDNSGSPRIVGFPNVVMAIDPTHINPMFQSIGFQAVEHELTTNEQGPDSHGHQDTSQSTSRRTVFAIQLIQSLLIRRPVVLAPVSQTSTSGSLSIPPSGDPLTVDPNRQYSVVGVPGTSTTGITVSLQDIETALSKYIQVRSAVKDAKATLVHRRVTIQNAINAELAAAQRATPPRAPQTNTQETQLQAINTQIADLNRNFDATPPEASGSQLVANYNTLASIVNSVSGTGSPQSRHRLDNATGVGTNSDANKVVLMSYLLGQFRRAGSNTGDTRTDPSGTIDTSANLLQMLSDRKASLSLTTPGYYRFYSASHPNPAMQGYLPVSTTDTADSGDVTTTGGTVTPSGHVTGPTQTVASQRTTMTGQQAAGYMITAWQSIHNGQNPPPGALNCLLAQWAIETGNGQSMFNYNFGGIKAVGAGLRTSYNTTEGDVVAGTATHGAAYFQAYGNADEGARHFVRMITQGQNRGVYAQYLSDLANNPGAAGTNYAQGLASTGYFTGNVQDYARNIQGGLGRAAGWVANAQFDNGPSDPLSGTQTPTTTAANIPPASYATVVVRPSAMEEGVPPDRQGSYVQVFPNFIPTNGLKVRVMDQRAPRVVPTNLIYSMTFEARGQERVTPISVQVFNPSHPAQLLGFIHSCQSPQTNDPWVVALTRTLVARVGEGMTAVRPTAADVQTLVGLAVDGITGLSMGNGLIQASPSVLNISNGTANNYDPTNTQSLRGPGSGPATAVLKAKAQALIAEVTAANMASLTQAMAYLTPGDTTHYAGARAPIPEQALGLLESWQTSLTALFVGYPPPQQGVFVPRSEVRLAENTTHEEFSPVFPVSDAQGFEHYGSFQYGRGLSIESGGNYEQLMASDPLQYLTDAQRETLLNAIVQHDPIQGEAALRQAAQALASNQNPDVQHMIQYMENTQTNGDRTTMIANGLRNYIASDRDAVNKLPVNNTAYQLADLAPMGQQDTCACRGAEADLLLAAYMSGTAGMVQVVDSDEEAAEWVSAQMQQAAVSWADTQSKMRGMAMDQGRRSLLDSLQGWNTVASQFRQTNASLANQANAVGSQAAVLGQNTHPSPTPVRGQ